MITLTPEQESELLNEAKSGLVAHLIKTRGKEMELLEAVEVSAILRTDKRAWEKLIPRVVISSSVIRYQMIDVVKLIEERKENP